MAGSEEDSIRELLQNYVAEKDLEGVVKKLCDNGYTSLFLREMPEIQVEAVIGDLFSEERHGTKAVLRAVFGSARKNDAASTKRLRQGQEDEDETAPAKRLREGKEDVEADVAATTRYFEALLKSPPELPHTLQDLKSFLSETPIKLPLPLHTTYREVRRPDLVTLDAPAFDLIARLASFIEFLITSMISSRPANEASSSSELANFTGKFMELLNTLAPKGRKLRGLEFRLDSANPRTDKVASQPLMLGLRPDFQMFVKNCLILRWENKLDASDLTEAMHENTSKMKAWSPLFYSKLRYVIGGACAGRQFQWLKLWPSGDGGIEFGFISDVYDLNGPGGVVEFIHSIIRMHCLLQKLQEDLGGEIRATLYKPIKRVGGGEVMVYPDIFIKQIVELDDEKLDHLEILYEMIAKSSYIIQGKFRKRSRARTVLELYPVGDPHSEPETVEDLEKACHDIVHGLKDLHELGYTHRDLRWPNFIKVNDRGVTKWVIIDLETAGCDNDEWAGALLQDWDSRTLEEDKDEKKIYTKGSDIYQFGRLILTWLDRSPKGSKGRREQMRSWGEEMKQKRTSAEEMLLKICEKDCTHCRGIAAKM